MEVPWAVEHGTTSMLYFKGALYLNFLLKYVLIIKIRKTIL